MNLQVFDGKAFRLKATAERGGRALHMKKLPLFEYEFPSYRKRHADWVDQKSTR